MVDIAEIDKMLAESTEEERKKMYNVGIELVSHYAKVLREEKKMPIIWWFTWNLCNYIVWKLREEI